MHRNRKRCWQQVFFVFFEAISTDILEIQSVVGGFKWPLTEMKSNLKKKKDIRARWNERNALKWEPATVIIGDALPGRDFKIVSDFEQFEMINAVKSEAAMATWLRIVAGKDSIRRRRRKKSWINWTWISKRKCDTVSVDWQTMARNVELLMSLLCESLEQTRPWWPPTCCWNSS